MAKHRDECFSDRGLHSVTSCLIKEASSGYSLNQPEWIITHEVILLGNLGEQDSRCPPSCFSKRGDLLKRHCIDEQRGELLFLFGSQSMLRTPMCLLCQEGKSSHFFGRPSGVSPKKPRKMTHVKDAERLEG